MRKILFSISSWIVLKIFSLRYSFEIKGLNSLNLKRKGGVLFLPNHPAEIDPITVFNLLARKFAPRPLVIEHFYYLKGVRFFMDLIRAFPIPNFDLSTNSWKVSQVNQCLDKVRARLKKGDNFLIYPSGQLKREGHENIGGNSFIHNLLQSSDEIQVVLVRTDGLWGSSFSCALTGNSPDFWKMMLHGIKKAFKNGIFFMPRRKVTVEFTLAPKDFPYKGSRLELNQYLENWYNRYEDDKGKIVSSEPLRLVSYTRFSKDFLPMSRKKEGKKEEKELPISEGVREAIYTELKKISGMKEIQEEMDLSRDLGLDSLDLASIHTFLDQRYDVAAVRPAFLKTVRDLLVLASTKDANQSKFETDELKRYAWPKEIERPEVYFPKGKTIPEAFLETVDRMGKTVACGDRLTGILSYQKLKLAILILAEKFKTFEEDYVAVMLPSSVGCYIITLAIMMARKTPVLLNWTAGERNLKFAMETLGLKQILSSRRFLERVDVLELGALEKNIVLMEDFRRSLSLKDKLLGFYLSKKGKKGLTKHFQLDRLTEEDAAVVLFTSGTENYPKGVPLSHRNLLSNQKGAFDCAGIKKEDILHGVLPPFHSFGFSITGLLPLLLGLRVFYAPDPTDTHAMARDIFYYQPTILCLAPSFYRNLFRIATPRQLKSVRLFVTGAEKAPQELFEHVKRLGKGKEMLEGYGITECAPIVTLNRPGKKPRGVGEPLPGVKLCIIDPEIGIRLANDMEGEIAIRGPNVFKGYLGKESPDPFVEVDGVEWYRSGDLGHIGYDGALILSGRLKRFVKIGGEMVSLVALEEELTQKAKEGKLVPMEIGGPPLAIGVREGDKPQLILFTTFPLTKEEANGWLKKGGFARIVKISESYQIDAIPLTGTGKVQLRALNELAKEKNA